MKEPKIGGLSLANLTSTLGTLFPSLNTGRSWDKEYASGGWDRLDSSDELARYAAILGYVTRLAPRPAVLDVGCGTGKLLELLGRIELSRYLGVDISSEAVQRARATIDHPAATFEVGSAETYRPSDTFDAIVFNEVAYYLRDPARVLLGYAEKLGPSGMLIVSMFQCPPASWAWRKLGRSFVTADAIQVKNRLGRRWNIRVLTPRR